jgi:putative acetyltransferase
MNPRDDTKEKPPRAGRLQGLIIRSASPADAEGLTALVNLPGCRYGTLRIPFQTAAETRQRLETLGPSGKEILAEYDGQIIGSLFLGPMLGRRRHVASLGMAVHDEYTGQGVGSALMRAALDVADNWLGLRRVELTVFVDNQSAIRLYEKSGFVKEGHLRQFAFRDGEYVDAYTMARLKA